MHPFRQLLLPDFHICIIKFCRDCYKLRTVSCQRDTSQVISKVLERLVYDKVFPHIQKYISLTDNLDFLEIDQLSHNCLYY